MRLNHKAKDVLKRAHTADAGVEMTVRVIQAFARIVLGNYSLVRVEDQTPCRGWDVLFLTRYEWCQPPWQSPGLACLGAAQAPLVFHVIGVKVRRAKGNDYARV